MSDSQSQNTDKELWRKVPGDYYSPSIHVTEQGSIGINIGGSVFVASVETWHKWASDYEALRARLGELSHKLELFENVRSELLNTKARLEETQEHARQENEQLRKSVEHAYKEGISRGMAPFRSLPDAIVLNRLWKLSDSFIALQPPKENAGG